MKTYNNELLSFYKNKKVLITGHTGFKGSWMIQFLSHLGANIAGYSLKPEHGSMYEICGLDKKVQSVYGDIRDTNKLLELFENFKPEIVIHMAAQPLVRESYLRPAYTFDVNVMGTVSILECIRKVDSIRSFLNVTTDKVYKNKEWEWGYRENEELNGFDPYSNSKSCPELVTSSYKNSFFSDNRVAISTARAGNVIGGGDFAADRIIPDCMRSAINNANVILRNPNSIRPYQHVLEPLYAYLLICMRQYSDSAYADSYNIGPNDAGCYTTGALAQLFCEKWNRLSGTDIKCITQNDSGPHEANFLRLDCNKFKTKYNWNPRWDIDSTMDKIVEWYMEYAHNGNMEICTQKQIIEFMKVP